MKNNFIINRMRIEHSYYNQFIFRNLTFGFTEINFKEEYFTKLVKNKEIKQLNQIHSSIIFTSSEIGNKDNEGDGIFLDNDNDIVIIRTADCTPLFFFSDDLKYKGILHVGWRGLYFSIIENLLENYIPQSYYKVMNFITGPAIERDCYEVGTDLYEKFSIKEYRDNIFIRKDEKKFLMDVVMGINEIIFSYDIEKNRIYNTNLCTFCNKLRFPSYRREKSGKRIYNFMYLN